MMLTSYDRMIRYLGAGGSSLSDNRFNKQIITNWIQSTSKQIEKYCNREFLISSYTEYFDTIKSNYIEFRVSRYPIVTLTDVYIDCTGEFNGSESEIDDCITNKHSSSVILPYDPPVLGYKTLRIRYTGGLAYSATMSLYTVAITGSWTIGNFVIGNTSGAVGILKAQTATTFTIEILYGSFEAGETLAEYTDEDITNATGNTATVTTIDRHSLFELYPDIIRAAEIQIRYYWKHKDDFELSGTNKDGTNIRNTNRHSIMTAFNPLTDECMSMLAPYKRVLI